MEWKIDTIQALKRQPKQDEAQRILERIAEHVLPICTKRKFKVKQLLEFFPKQSNLLGMNVNQGWKIYLRCTYTVSPRLVVTGSGIVRPAPSPTTFLPFHDILGTMLHELVHMLIGPHNASFYKLLDELTDEMENLMARDLIGMTGAVFQDAGDGQSLGGTKVLRSQLSAVRAKAAQRRQQHQAIMHSGRLGGDPIHVDSPAALRAKVLAAAEKRQRDAIACALVTSAHNADNDDDDDSLEWRCPHCTFWNAVSLAACEMCQRPLKRKLPKPPKTGPPPSPTHVIDLTQD
ncbi:Aste57867_13932 [Aphanomyces stellatus]|uniref:Aste57867_13932 protein n=1 Tax=Aphanomyces stellatus TaxID=120398 RepID=A0A485KZZ5_9STRA|nr:hypothetical protein As57867_013881 [Aphanomyces stellatus]VFT90762.1 Aste57867_13932 [Aphanomyces stellatus]